MRAWSFVRRARRKHLLRQTDSVAWHHSRGCHYAGEHAGERRDVRGHAIDTHARRRQRDDLRREIASLDVPTEEPIPRRLAALYRKESGQLPILRERAVAAELSTSLGVTFPNIVDALRARLKIDTDSLHRLLGATLPLSSPSLPDLAAHLASRGLTLELIPSLSVHELSTILHSAIPENLRLFAPAVLTALASTHSLLAHAPSVSMTDAQSAFLKPLDRFLPVLRPLFAHTRVVEALRARGISSAVDLLQLQPSGLGDGLSVIFQALLESRVANWKRTLANGGHQRV